MSSPILVALQEAGEAHMVVGLLQRAGYSVVGAADGTDALNKISDKSPWLILLDENLSDMTGKEFLDQANLLMKHWPYALMLLANGSPSERLKVEMMLMKPFNPRELLYFVNLLGEKERQGEKPCRASD